MRLSYDQIDQLHDLAMAKAQDAMVARFRGDAATSQALYCEAFEFEAKAATALAGDYEYEPTRSVYFRSAANIALLLGQFRDAERMATFGLSGNPPDEIAEELREVYENANFQRHLELRGSVLDDEQFQITVAGNAVGHGFIDESVWTSRLDAMGKILARTIQRKNNCTFDDKSLVKDYRIAYGVPEAACYAMPFRLIRPNDTLFRKFATAKDIVTEVFECLDLFETKGEEGVHEHIVDEKFSNHFIALARAIGPDGKDVKQVGLINPAIRSEPVALRTVRKRRKSPTKKVEIEPVTQEFRGILSFADKTRDDQKDSVKIRDPEGNLHQFVVPEELIDDIVKPLWGQSVVVWASIKKNKMTLLEIEADKESPSGS